jgi:head-tail adaptor
MMQSGKLQHHIELQRMVETVQPSGAVSEV